MSDTFIIPQDPKRFREQLFGNSGIQLHCLIQEVNADQACLSRYVKLGKISVSSITSALDIHYTEDKLYPASGKEPAGRQFSSALEIRTNDGRIMIVPGFSLDEFSELVKAKVTRQPETEKIYTINEQMARKDQPARDPCLRPSSYYRAPFCLPPYGRTQKCEH